MRLIDADFLRERFGMDSDGECSKCRHDENHCGYNYETCLMDVCCAIDDAPAFDSDPLQHYQNGYKAGRLSALDDVLYTIGTVSPSLKYEVWEILKKHMSGIEVSE